MVPPWLRTPPFLSMLFRHVPSAERCRASEPFIAMWVVMVGTPKFDAWFMLVIVLFYFSVVCHFMDFLGIIMLFPIFRPAQSFKSKAQWILGSKRRTHPALLSLHSRGKRLESSLDGRARDSAPRFGNHLPHVVSCLDKIWATHTHTSIHTHTWISLYIYIYIHNYLLFFNIHFTAFKHLV